MRPVGCQRRVSRMYCIDMNIPRTRVSIWHAVVLACALGCVCISTIPGRAQEDKGSAANDKPGAGDKSATADKAGAGDKSTLPPLPADAHVQQSMVLDGKTLDPKSAV